MEKYQKEIDLIFFSNNGEIDQLTGAMAPNRFDQIVKRDLAISDRSRSNLSMISITLDIEKFLVTEVEQESATVITAIEGELVKITFILRSIFRESDCFCRVSQLGFWVFFVSKSRSESAQVIERARKLLPSYCNISISHRGVGEKQIDWYTKIDQIHF
jgi:GGDEF domain-containing protein